MRCNICPIVDAYAMFDIDLQLLILAKTKHHFRGHSAALIGDVQNQRSSSTRFECPYTCAVPPARIARSETVADKWRWVEPKRPYATDGAVAQELRRYHVTLE